MRIYRPFTPCIMGVLVDKDRMIIVLFLFDLAIPKMAIKWERIFRSFLFGLRLLRFMIFFQVLVG